MLCAAKNGHYASKKVGKGKKGFYLRWRRDESVFVLGHSFMKFGYSFPNEEN